MTNQQAILFKLFQCFPDGNSADGKDIRKSTFCWYLLPAGINSGFYLRQKCIFDLQIQGA